MGKTPRVKNPRTGELLPEGYDLDDFHIIAPDGFRFPIIAKVEREAWWREKNESAKSYLRDVAKPFASEEEARRAIRKPAPANLIQIINAGTSPKLEDAGALPEGVSGDKIRDQRAQLPEENTSEDGE